MRSSGHARSAKHKARLRVTVFSPCNANRRGTLDDMRRLLLALVVVSACASPSAPSAAVAGTWQQNLSVVGASLVLTIDGAGNGSGTYAIEAGRSGAVDVTGHVAASTLTLAVHYDYGPVRTFTGTQTDATHLTGTFDDGSGTTVFTRR